MWALQQRRIVAQAFIAGCRYHKAHWHLKQDTLEGMDERLIDVHLDHCRNVFEESKGCENQHPYVSLQREAERQTPTATVRTNNSSNRMSVDPSRNSSNKMSVQAVNRPGKRPGTPNAGAVVTTDMSSQHAQSNLQGPGPKDPMDLGAASRVGDRPRPRDKGGPKKRTAQDKYNKWLQLPSPQ